MWEFFFFLALFGLASVTPILLMFVSGPKLCSFGREWQERFFRTARRCSQRRKLVFLEDQKKK
jgi:hypothetical protein